MKRKTFAAVTSQQVAQLAGVSQSAVSRTFTPGASISPATREKVLKAARELGYRPNAIARSLNTARSRIIGVVISYFDNPFYSQVLEALAQKLDTLNYHLLLFVGDRDGNVDRIFDQIMQYRVDGIVLASVTLSLELSEECLAAGIPVVLFNRSEESGMASSVNSNNEAAARQIAEFLLAGEHKRFAYVGGVADSPVNIARQRLHAGRTWHHRCAGGARELRRSANHPGGLYPVFGVASAGCGLCRQRSYGRHGNGCGAL